MKKLINVLFCENTNDLIQRLLVVVGIIYLGLFSLEAIIPGIIVDVFNINFLLLCIIFAIVYHNIVYSKKNGNVTSINLALFPIMIFFMIALVALVIIIVQYKISLLESFVNLVFVMLIGKTVYELI